MIRVTLLLLTAIFIYSAPAAAQESSADRGQTLFQSECARCHVQAEIEMRLRNDWLGEPADGLFEVIKATMPAETPGSLSDEQYLDLTAYVMRMGRVNAPPGNVTLAQLADTTIAERSGQELAEHPWPIFNGDPGANRYSPLNQINEDNVADLEIAWTWSAANYGPQQENIYVTEPLMVNGRMYATAGATRNVVSIDPATGQTLWMYRTEEGERFDNAPRKNSGKGLSYWSDGEQEIIFFVTPGYSLVALDAETGLPIDTFGEKGWVDLHEGLRTPPDYIRDDDDITLTFPPTIIDDVIVVGAAHLVSFRPPHAQNIIGDVRAYDVHTGSHLWTFKTIPERGEYGFDTWHDGTAETAAGNTGVWTAMSFDKELGHVYLPVESATGDRYGGFRPGNNLYSGSVVAVDYRTGEKQWYFQHLRHDIWDYDTPSAPVLVDLPDGSKYLVQLTKQAFAYVLDRETGEPVWEMKEVPVPQSDTPGEWTADTQPFPTKPPAYDRQGFSEDDLIDFTPEVRQLALEAIQDYRIGPLFEPPSLLDHPDGTRGTLSLPGTLGGSNWEGAAYDPATGMLYIPSRTDAAVLALVPGGDASTVDYIAGPGRTPTVDGLPIVQPPWGRVTKMNLNDGSIEWWVANADTPEHVKNHPLLEGVDIPRTGIPTRSGLLLTSELLFVGEGQGGGPYFRAHDKETGELIATIELPASQTGTPITYMHEGTQYIVMAVSSSGVDPQIVALALPD